MYLNGPPATSDQPRPPPSPSPSPPRRSPNARRRPSSLARGAFWTTNTMHDASVSQLVVHTARLPIEPTWARAHETHYIFHARSVLLAFTTTASACSRKEETHSGGKLIKDA
jgi:hypothetical protein